MSPAYVRGAGEDALDAHGFGSLFVHIGQLAVVIGAAVAFWGNWRLVGGALAFLVLAVAQLAFLDDTDEEGGWVNGLHGFLALVILLSATWYAARATWGSAAPARRSTRPSSASRTAAPCAPCAGRPSCARPGGRRG